MRECNEYEITIEKLLKFYHQFTETLMIHVVNDKWIDCKKIKGLKRLGDFYLTCNAYKDTERLLKYYKDVPVWNLCACLENNGRNSVKACLHVHCYFSDCMEEFLKEREDLKKSSRAKRRAK